MIRNKCINEKGGVTPIVKMMVESYLGWFGHARRRPIEVSLMRVDQIMRYKRRVRPGWIKPKPDLILKSSQFFFSPNWVNSTFT